MNIRDCDGDPASFQTSVAKRQYGSSRVVTLICHCLAGIHIRERITAPCVSFLFSETILHNLSKVVLRSPYFNIWVENTSTQCRNIGLTWYPTGKLDLAINLMSDLLSYQMSESYLKTFRSSWISRLAGMPFSISSRPHAAWTGVPG